MSEKYYGNYIGIVISDPAQDPEKRNRAQVWVPSITNTLYKGWNDTQTDKNRNKLPEGMINRLRNSLPWAECASPLIGGGAPFFSNSATGIYDSDPAATVVNDDQNLDTEQEPIDPLPPIDLSMPVDDAQLDNEIPIDNQNLLMDEEPADPLAVSSNENVTVDGPIFPDTPQNNAPGSGDTLPPVEPPLPEDDSVMVPSTPTVADQTGEPQAPAQTKPEGPLVIQTQAQVATIRKGDLSTNLVQTLQNGLRGTGLAFRVASGGQPPSGPNRVGSDRHNFGNAADGDFIEISTGRTLNPNTSLQDRQIISNALSNLRAAGIQGVGWGVGYMGEERFHLDVVRDGVWGAEGKSANAASWVVDAVNSGGQVSPTALASSETSTPSIPNDYADANSSVPYGGAGTATGTFSTISHLAKVWVFFYGGDIQRPVYFAQVTDPSSISQVLQNDPNAINLS